MEGRYVFAAFSGDVLIAEDLGGAYEGLTPGSGTPLEYPISSIRNIPQSFIIA